MVNIVWPCPDLSRVAACLKPGLQAENLDRAIREANELFFYETGSKYAGCRLFMKVRVCKPCSCGVTCGSCVVDKIDLRGITDYPAIELVDVEINGVTQPLSGWELRENRYLVRPPGGWPMQEMQTVDGGECTWSFTVRIGREPPLGLLTLRDFYVGSLIGGDCQKQNVSKITLNGTQYELENLDPLKKARELFFRPVNHMLADWGSSIFEYEYEIVRSWFEGGCDAKTLLNSFVDPASPVVYVPGEAFDKYGAPLP